MLKSLQERAAFNEKIIAESFEQARKASFLMIHIQYTALQGASAKKDFMKMINDPEICNKQEIMGAMIMKYPALVKELDSKEYESRADELMGKLKLKKILGVLMYENISDLEKAYDSVITLY